MVPCPTSERARSGLSVKACAAVAISVLLSMAASAGITSFTASPTSFLPGQQVTLSWSATSGDVVSIAPGVGSVSGGTASITVVPEGTTTYTLSDSTAGTSAQVTVRPAAVTAVANRWSFNEGGVGTTVTDSLGAQNGLVHGPRSGEGAWSRTSSQIVLGGGASSVASYIDLPNGLLAGRSRITFEGWMTINGSQPGARIFDFGRCNQTSNGGATGELIGPGNPSGNTIGTDYLQFSAQSPTSPTRKRLALRDNAGTEQGVNLVDPATLGQQFHFAVVYDAEGNGGSPIVRYYRNGSLIGSLVTRIGLAKIEDVNNWLGRSNHTSDPNLNGSFNEFRIWNGALGMDTIADSVGAGPDKLPNVPWIESFAVFPSTAVYTGESARLSYLFSNPGGGAITASIDQGIGTLTDTSGYMTVTPTAATTTYTLTVTAGTITRTAQVRVTLIPGAPTAEDMSLSANYQTATAVTLVANDYNTNKSSLKFSIVDEPTHGTLSGAGSRRIYTPANGFSGTDRFTYKASDGTADSNIATVSIAVNPAPAAPTNISLDVDSLFGDLASGAFVGLLRAADGNPDDTFTFTLVSGAGATHNGHFTIVGNQLIATHDFSGDLNQTISVRVRVTDSAGKSFEQVITRPVEARSRHVKINEINYNPARNTQRTEFVELHNPTGADVNIGNWRLAKALDYTIPAGTRIPAGGYVVLAEDPVTIQALYGVAALGPWTGGLGSDGDEVELRDAAGSTVDKVSYGTAAPWPVPPDGDGPSLELIHPALNNNLGGNWRASKASQREVSYVTAASGSWKYFRGKSEASSPITAWRAEGYNDAEWFTGTMPIGLFKQNSNIAIAASPETGVKYGTQLTDMATYVGNKFMTSYRSVFFRKTFEVSGPIPRSVSLRVLHNDAAIVWINGVEVARFGFQPAAPTDPPFDTNAYYELGNDPWSEQVLLNAGALLHSGTNTIAIEGFAKPPMPRTTIGFESLTDYYVFDFAIDAELRSSPDILGTPGAQNSVFAGNAPPAVHEISHAPKAPKPWDPIVVTAKVSDPQGVGSVQLKYQLCTAGKYIPSTLPYSRDELLTDPTRSLRDNPGFEDPSNWATVTMVDDGSFAGDVAGDGVFTVRIPAMPNRTLIRYRIVAGDLAGASATVPAADDPRKNFATYCYHRVPVWTGNGQAFGPETLTTLPVYQWLTRSSDWTSLLAYTAADQVANVIDLNAILAREYENFAGTLIVGEQVIDHVHMRLRGGNSRYLGSGKRQFRFNFPKGTSLHAADERGRKYPRPWEAMLFNRMFGNKGAYDFGIPYEVGSKLWSQQGIPMPESHWVHFRVVQNVNENEATHGDFWGMYQALELPEGKNFLGSRGLPPGNFYKMTDRVQNAEMDERYQAKGAPDFGEDFDNIRYNMHQTASQSDLERYMNMPLWYRYDAVKEAIRHYDVFCEPTGRHRVKNLIWYFAPQEGNPLGRLTQIPYDWDASFGPNFNSGWDFIHNAIYDHADITDSPTWAPPKLDRTGMRIEHRNAIRELRDLVWYRDANTNRGPFDDMVDDALATIQKFQFADMARWPSPGALGVWPGGAPAKAQDMKNFAFAGWSDAFGGDPAVPAGGRAAYLDGISDGMDAGQLPATPTISYTGAADFPVDGLAFRSSAFIDPQGATTFGAMQWRVGEVTDPAAPKYDATAERIYEATSVWESGTLAAFNASVTVPGTALRAGHAYRARVRHRDATGRWSHWSAPVQFIPGESNYIQVLRDNLMVSELMYHPAPPAAGYAESAYEFIELLNISPTLTLDLTNVRFTKGADFDFAGSAVTSLAPGARVLVVKNADAFLSRYGSGKPIAGEWDPLDSLDNSGEEVKLSYGAGAAIQEFTYDDAAPWPTKADEGGYSLVLKDPASRPNHALASNWRASFDLNGTPGGAGTRSYEAWAAANGAPDISADDDGDGLANLLEYALGGKNGENDRGLLPTGSIQTIAVNDVSGNYLTLKFRRSMRAEDVACTAQFSSDLRDWSVPGVLVSSTDNGDGSVTDVWRAPLPTNAAMYFARMRVTRR
jgi:hypothetical protein